MLVATPNNPTGEAIPPATIARWATKLAAADAPLLVDNAYGEFCQYDVGVAGDQVVMASLQGGRPDSCTALQAVLPAMLATLPVLPA